MAAHCFQFMPTAGWTPAAGGQPETLYNLEETCCLFFTGYSRSASSILKGEKQEPASRPQHDRHLHFVKDLGYQSKEALEAGDLTQFAELMDVHWQHNKKRSGSMSNGKIDEWYKPGPGQRRPGRQADRRRRRRLFDVLRRGKDLPAPGVVEAGLREVRFRFDFEGTRTVL